MGDAGFDAPEFAGLDDWTFIASGAHGEVWAATERSLGRRVAVKILPRLSDPTARHRFRVESTAIGSLTGHPSILAVHRSAITDDGRGVLVMEHGDRSLADDLAEHGTLSVEQVAKIIEKIAAGLDAAHAAGVLHLDVKPSNIIVSAFGEPKLADFGVSAVVRRPIDATIDDIEEWVAGMTPGYGPAELLEGAPPSTATDVHLLAATAVALLTGSPPYCRPGDSPIDVWQRTLAGPGSLEGMGLPPSLVPALESGLARDPAQRPPSAGVFARLLADGVGDLPASSARSSSSDSSARPRQRWGLYIAVLAVVVAAIGLAALRGESGGGADSLDRSGGEVWIDSGLWGGVALLDVQQPELVSVIPGQEVTRPLLGSNGSWALETDAATPSVRRIDASSGATMAVHQLSEQDGRSSCTMIGGQEVWAVCTADLWRLPNDPGDLTLRPSVTLYRLSNSAPQPILRRDGALSLGAAHGAAVWLVIDDPAAAVGSLVIRVEDVRTESARLPIGSAQALGAVATTEGLWLVDGRAVTRATVSGPGMQFSEPVVWNFTTAANAPISTPVPLGNGIAFLVADAANQLLRSIHVSGDSVVSDAEVEFPYDLPGLTPSLAITDSGRAWTVGVSAASRQVVMIQFDPFGVDRSDDLVLPGRQGPFSDPLISSFGDDVVALIELPDVDVSAVIVDGESGRIRAQLPLQPRSLLPLVGPDRQVVVADIWTASVWLVDETSARAIDAPAVGVLDPPVGAGAVFGVAGRQRGAAWLFDWDGDRVAALPDDATMLSDGEVVWYATSDEVGTVDPSTGRATPAGAATGTVSVFAGTRGLVRDATVIDGDLWRLVDGGVERVRADGTVSVVDIDDAGDPLAIGSAPTGDVVALFDDATYFVDPATERVIRSSSAAFTMGRTGYLVSDEVGLWWVSLYDGGAARLGPESGRVLATFEGLGAGIATADVSDGVLVVAHETSGTVTRVDASDEVLTKVVGSRPYWVDADGDVVVVGLQGDRAIVQFDTDALTERWRRVFPAPAPTVGGVSE